MTEEQEEDIEKQLNTDDEDLVNVDGTKVKLSGKLLKVCYTLLPVDIGFFLFNWIFCFDTINRDYCLANRAPFLNHLHQIVPIGLPTTIVISDHF